MKYFLLIAILLGNASFAFAQVTPSTEQAVSNPGGMSEAQARYAADAAGFAPASNLMPDGKGNWTGGSAAKGYFMIDKTGKVTPRS
jgi:hypothetical protein